MLERIIDMAAVELGIDPVEIRRRNFIPPERFPLTTVTGANYDVGEYAKALDEACGVAGYDALRAEQTARRDRGDAKQLGIGVCTYVEVTGRRSVLRSTARSRSTTTAPSPRPSAPPRTARATRPRSR